jgi:PhoPQ-activated pathogenicity-related protein
MALLLALLFWTASSAPVQSDFVTALDIYVAQADPNYSYAVWSNASLNGVYWKGTILKMTSQQWLTPADWNRGNPNTSDALWWHWMSIIVPEKLDPRHMDTALLWVTGGSNNNGPPTDPATEDNGLTATLCMDMGVVGAALYQIPNEPIYFTDEVPPVGRSEDALIAWTWLHYINMPGPPNVLNNNTEWIVQLPMTKAAVRAMDTVADFRKSTQTINKFIVSGASKRGWVTWTTGLVDDRVIAIIPIVLDALHLIPSLHHMWRAYGGWTFAFQDYYNCNITSNLDTVEMEWMCMIIDPFYYIADPVRFQMPKLVINAAGDEFLQGDNDQYWWTSMPGPKFRQMCQNAEHSEITGIPNLLPTISAWGNAVLQNAKQPNFTWTIDPVDGHITVYNDPTIAVPINVTMWWAPSYFRHGLRDWRLAGGYDPTLPQLVYWLPTHLQETAPGSNMWIASQKMPETGWMGFFVEVIYNGIAPFWNPDKLTQYRLTTQISIIPVNVWPFPDCNGEGCYGTLV